MMRRKTPSVEITSLSTRNESKLDTTLTQGKSTEDDVQVTETRGVSMTWKNLEVSAKIEKRHIFRSTRTLRKIIHNVNGYVEPNSLVAILGASGSGKSTLMSVLASRQIGNFEINGSIRVNGKEVEFDVMKTICGFVYQDDIFINALTVLEHLHFVGKLKLSKRLTREQRELLVDELITNVGLTECANRLICSSKYGSEKTNLSGGELKRLSVATELLTNPALLFCDEPTTGLDSFTAFNLMKVMSDLTRQKAKTIVCSIHQPSAKIFDLFDQIILLQNGQVAFNGTATDAMVFFQSIGYSYNENQNPADYLVKSLAVVPDGQGLHADEEFDICMKFQRSQYNERVERRIEQENREQNFILPKNVERISWFYMFFLLTYRNALDVIRNPRVQLLSIGNNLLDAVIIGVTMLGTVTFTQYGVTALKAVLYAMTSHNSLMSSTQILNHFPSRMPSFLREYSTGMNRPSIFYLSHAISFIPGLVFGGILHVAILYSLTDLKRDWYAFWATTAIAIGITFAGSAFGILVSVAIDRSLVHEAVVTAATTILNLLTGIWINLRSIPWTIKWLQYISWTTYAIEAMFILQLKDVDHISCSTSPELPCLKNGQEVLDSLGFDANNFQRNVITICCICLILHVLGFTALKVKLYFMTNR